MVYIIGAILLAGGAVLLGFGFKKLLAAVTALVMATCTLVGTQPSAAVELPSHEAVLAALWEADIPTLSHAMDMGLFSCQELTAYYLERIEEYNDTYNCFITLCDNAMEVARQRDLQREKGEAKGLLFGIPVVVKDNIDVAGYLTTNGYPKATSRTASADATVARYLLEQGAVIIGKTNMSTGAMDARKSGSLAAGEVLGAYNPLLAPGGSSGGSAVAVSLNFAAAGLGTDTNSSLRIPAVLAGCVSLRPTTGLIDRQGTRILNPSRDAVGAITRTVYDQAVMLDVISGGMGYTENLDKNALEGLKIGVLKELSYPLDRKELRLPSALSAAMIRHFDIDIRTEKHIDSEIALAFEKALSSLEECGAEIVTVSMPDLWRLSYPTFSDNRQWKKDALYNSFEKLMKQNELNAVVFPSYLSTPMKMGRDETGKYWSPSAQPFSNNCYALAPSAGLPELSVPIGLHSSGAGMGMEIASLKNSEQLLLNIGYSWSLHEEFREAPQNAPCLYGSHFMGTLKEIIALHEIIVECDSPQLFGKWAA